MSETITKDEMKALIKEEKILPSDLFGVEMLTEDPLVKSYVTTAVKELKGKLEGEYLNRQRKTEGFDKTREELEEQAKEKDEEIKKLKTAGAKRDAVDLFTSKIKERKLDEKQTQFIEAKQADFVSEDPEKIDKEVDTFMDDSLKEYNKTAKIFGHETEEKIEPKGGGGPGSEEIDDTSHIPD